MLAAARGKVPVERRAPPLASTPSYSPTRQCYEHTLVNNKTSLDFVWFVTYGHPLYVRKAKNKIAWSSINLSIFDDSSIFIVSLSVIKLQRFEKVVAMNTFETAYR